MRGNDALAAASMRALVMRALMQAATHSTTSFPTERCVTAAPPLADWHTVFPEGGSGSLQWEMMAQGRPGVLHAIRTGGPGTIVIELLANAYPLLDPGSYCIRAPSCSQCPTAARWSASTIGAFIADGGEITAQPPPWVDLPSIDQGQGWGQLESVVTRALSSSACCSRPRRLGRPTCLWTTRASRRPSTAAARPEWRQC